MSTRIKPAQIQVIKTYKKKSQSITQSQVFSPSQHTKQLYNNDSQQIQKQQILQLEIKQLQKQNSFLKKKINQLMIQINGQHKYNNNNNKNKKYIYGKGIIKEDLDYIHLSVDFFFKEINNLIHSIINLFKIQFNQTDIFKYLPEIADMEQNITAQKKYHLYKKYTLAKKLQKVSLESQDKRYQMLLEVFSSYYSAKEECDRYVKQIVDQLSTKTLELNKLMLKNANKRKNSLKESHARSTFTVDDSSADKLLSKDYQASGPWNLRRLHPPTLTGLKNEWPGQMY